MFNFFLNKEGRLEHPTCSEPTPGPNLGDVILLFVSLLGSPHRITQHTTMVLRPTMVSQGKLTSE